MAFRKHILKERNRRTGEALSHIKYIDEVKEVWPLEDEEASEQKRCKGVVEIEDR